MRRRPMGVRTAEDLRYGTLTWVFGRQKVIKGARPIIDMKQVTTEDQSNP
jgi:hypothetical protein